MFEQNMCNRHNVVQTWMSEDRRKSAHLLGTWKRRIVEREVMGLKTWEEATTTAAEKKNIMEAMNALYNSPVKEK